MYGGYNQECCYPVSAAPSYGYGEQCGGGGGCFGSGFALIIVLFILLIIVGACLC
ncbi:YjcZ family sporulation protein [Peribacillus sp. SI8-4]|uniref:YjcZ family sporulation protein n=1 Tax=Peribacillus sp. SI8-4 TaxID=3048009 RepID=UPI002554D627|nr:YjcZ family sporulation protein [Peribacillus sp. SI8-4]